MLFIFERDFPGVSFLTALHMLSDLLNIELQCLYLLHLNQISISFDNQSQQWMKYSFVSVILLLILNLTFSLPEPVYTIHYVRSYRTDQIAQNFGCGKSIIFGTYIHPLGPVDALYALMNSHIYGFNSNCQRPSTYVKIFGQAQDFTKLTDSNIIDQIGQVLGRTIVRNVIVDWKYLPESDQRQKALKSLEATVNSLKNRGFNVSIKAPASYFCLNVNGKRFILDQPANDFIVQLYGQEPGKYVTYESIFDNAGTQDSQEGYSRQCPKFPTIPQLQRLASSRKVYIQKTLDSYQPGYIGANLQKFLEKAAHKDIYFYDGYPKQTVDF